MAQARIIDYYSILALPSNADLTGIANAYSRLADELATSIGSDQASREGLVRLNEAYSVLSNPEARRKYDDVYFSQDRVVLAKKNRKRDRKRNLLGNLIVGCLLLVVVAQALFLVYIGREQVSGAAEVVLGPLFPDSAS